jgi:hypothetical protein
MRADLEEELERRVRAGETARDIIEDLFTRGAVESRKQPFRTLEKWCDRGWWDYGTSADLGWFTDSHPRGSNLDAHGLRTASPTP